MVVGETCVTPLTDGTLLLHRRCLLVIVCESEQIFIFAEKFRGLASLLGRDNWSRACGRKVLPGLAS